LAKSFHTAFLLEIFSPFFVFVKYKYYFCRPDENITDTYCPLAHRYGSVPTMLLIFPVFYGFLGYTVKSPYYIIPD